MSNRGYQGHFQILTPLHYLRVRGQRTLLLSHLYEAVDFFLHVYSSTCLFMLVPVLFILASCYTLLIIKAPKGCFSSHVIEEPFLIPLSTFQ